MKRTRPKGEDLLTSRLVTASDALLRLARCPELAARIAAAQQALEDSVAPDEWGVTDSERWDRWSLAHGHNIEDLANVLSCLAVPDLAAAEVEPWTQEQIDRAVAAGAAIAAELAAEDPTADDMGAL